MKKRLIMGLILGVLALPISAFAKIDSVDLRGLSEEQKAQLVQQAEQMKQQSGTNETIIEKVSNPENLNKWVEVGKGMGIAIAEVAQHVGMAADKFLESSAGKITLALIIWKVIGTDLVHVFGGIAFMLVFIPMWFYFFKRICLVKSIRYLKPTDGYKTIKEYEFCPSDDDYVNGTRAIMLLVLALIVVVGLVTIFSM